MNPKFLLLSSFLLGLGAAAQAAPEQLKIKLSAEEASGVFFDRDSLASQTPLLFGARVENHSAEDRDVNVTWRIKGSDGREKWGNSSKFKIAAGDSIVRRALFDAPGRGGYLLEVTASYKEKGPDVEEKASLPFAVTVSPSPNAAGTARPQSFFVLGTPALLSENQLDFYSRIGARVLRSALPPEPAQPDWPAVEAQLGARLRRNLATIALLPVTGEVGQTSEAYFARQVPSTLAHYAALTTWELSGDLSPADLDGWAQLAHARRRDLALLGPLPSGLPPMTAEGNATLRLRALDGATFEWPSNIESHPSALRRLWLSRGQAAKNAGLAAFHLRRDEDLSKAQLTPASVAGQSTADFLSAIIAGASSMSEVLAPPAEDETGTRAMAQGAAFAMLTRTLEDAIYREELFPRSPGLDGALFRAPRGSIAVLYSTSGEGKLAARVSPARVYDVFGNQIGADRNGRIELPLNDQPVYVISDVAADVLGFALRDAKIDGLRALEAQVLPVSRRPGLGTTGGGFGLRVRLQNVGTGTRTGRLQLDAPKGWKLASNRYDYTLNEGDVKTFEFRVEKSIPGEGPFPITVTAGGNSPKQTWRQVVPLATADNIAPGTTPRLDGNLDDWASAAWMTAGPNAGNASAKVALRWDGNRLFIAAQVRETGLVARRSDEPSYDFWDGHDALQIAFGTAESSESAPRKQPFQDATYGFLLCPFNQPGTNQYDGRLLRLWSPEKPYNTVLDHVRWGGAVPGASCVISRDEKAGITTYEARLPLSAIPELQPLEKAAKDGLVRFGWLLHNDEGSALDWGRTVGNFPWWDNTSTFLPEGELTSALRATLGFTQTGDVDMGLEPKPAAPAVRPLPVPTPTRPAIVPVPPASPPQPMSPAPRPTPRPTPRPQPQVAPFMIPPAPAPPVIPNNAPPTDDGMDTPPPPRRVPPSPPASLPFLPPTETHPIRLPSAAPPRGKLMPPPQTN